MVPPSVPEVGEVVQTEDENILTRPGLHIMELAILEKLKYLEQNEIEMFWFSSHAHLFSHEDASPAADPANTRADFLASTSPQIFPAPTENIYLNFFNIKMQKIDRYLLFIGLKTFFSNVE